MQISLKLLLQAVFHIGFALANGYVHFMAPEEIVTVAWPWLAAFWLLLAGFTVHHGWMVWCGYREEKRAKPEKEPEKTDNADVYKPPRSSVKCNTP